MAIKSITLYRGIVFKRLLIPRLQDRFISLVEIYMQEKKISQQDLASYVKIPASHLSNLLHKKRTLSANYIMDFIMNGVIMANELYDGRAMTEKERDFWTTCDAMQRLKLLHKIVTAEKLGFDVETIVESLIESKRSK